MADGLSLAVEEQPSTHRRHRHPDRRLPCARSAPQVAGVIGNDQALVEQVRRPRRATDEPVWQLPLDAGATASSSTPTIADMKNIGGANAGAITAALFLEEFVGDVPWAHIDIAGPAQCDDAAGWRTHRRHRLRRAPARRAGARLRGAVTAVVGGTARGPFTARRRDLLVRLQGTRERHEWLDHLGRAGQRYFAQRGNHFAAATAFFSILTAVPLLMVAFAAASYVLWFNPALLTELENAIAASVPSGLSEAVNPILETAIEQRNSIGFIGLVAALWSGVWWMSNLREAVSAQWELPAPHPAALQRLLYDLRALAGLGAALVVTFAFTVLGAGLAELVLGWLGAPDDGFTRTLLRLVGIVLGVGANWLIFAWAITRLPRTDVALRGVRRAALLGAVGFEVIKQGAAVYFEVITGTPGGAVFGSLLGLLLFGYLVARLLLWVTAWAATSRGNERPVPLAPPAPAVLGRRSSGPGRPG